jgi:aromatic ring-opening dioxygenase catalytic subunit (LigB family)
MSQRQASFNKGRQILYLAHGGGPLPLLNDGNHDEMLSHLKRLALQMTKPEAIILVSAHWESEQLSVTASSEPELLYDYYGFPEEAYEIEYPALGKPDLAERIAGLMAQENLPCKLDEHRGFDHGMFVPLRIMYPEADVPCVQLSLLNNLNAAEHIAVGEALAKLEYDNLLIIGSGFSFHNMQANLHDPQESNRKNVAFESWLVDVFTNQTLNEEERKQQLVNWEQAPHARYCHPREEHLLPLHVCYGAAQGICEQVFELKVFDKKVSMYLW